MSERPILLPMSKRQALIGMIVESLNDITKLQFQRKALEGIAALDVAVQQQLRVVIQQTRVKEKIVERMKGWLENPNGNDMELDVIPLEEFLRKVQTEGAEKRT